MSKHSSIFNNVIIENIDIISLLELEYGCFMIKLTHTKKRNTLIYCYYVWMVMLEIFHDGAKACVILY